MKRDAGAPLSVQKPNRNCTSLTARQSGMSATPPMQPAPAASSKPKDSLDMDSASRTPVRGGYARLARFMGDVPNAAIFRRFTHLSAEVLLHYQSELCDLEAELKRVQEEDHLSTDIRKFYSSSSQLMRESEYCYQDDSSDTDSIVEPGDENDPDNEDKCKSGDRGNINDHKDPSGDNDGDVIRDEHKAQRAQWLLLKRIREVTRDYYSALALHQQIASLKKPHPVSLDALRTYMRRPSMGNMRLLGQDGKIWESSAIDELVSIEAPNEDGSAMPGSTLTLLKIYHDFVGRHLHVCDHDTIIVAMASWSEGC
ncbi:uncharacterized protein F5Z01DRAFT_655142 [Emericellopsis atlantica]|uniref:DUF6594 domain-containing protein n=1 Tax=Emericellopsis atlantica TaxID=2614577 RepID=A0A9P8CP03_9HYPO|nr:uncharacterized protein F5Z01DRAFT_655142 [Emericellopsis atlantica]KAG9254324.1 hypothetical protein F5Z01DRAFT_655142 [Emericellopsis atlantica]